MNNEQLIREGREVRGEKREVTRKMQDSFFLFSLLSAKRSLFSLLVLMSLSACQAVKPYQRMYLNDKDMALKLRQIEGYESNIHAYREGAAGANGGKAGGGCGCN